MAQNLSKAGFCHIITLDLHQKEIQGFFECPVDNLRLVTAMQKSKIFQKIIYGKNWQVTLFLKHIEWSSGFRLFNRLFFCLFMKRAYLSTVKLFNVLMICFEILQSSGVSGSHKMTIVLSWQVYYFSSVTMKGHRHTYYENCPSSLNITPIWLWYHEILVMQNVHKGRPTCEISWAKFRVSFQFRRTSSSKISGHSWGRNT